MFRSFFERFARAFLRKRSKKYERNMGDTHTPAFFFFACVAFRYHRCAMDSFGCTASVVVQKQRYITSRLAGSRTGPRATSRQKM